MKTPRQNGKAIAKKKKNLQKWKGRTITTTATDTEQPRIYDMPEIIEEVQDNREVNEQKETTADKATDKETDNYYMRILIKRAKILKFCDLDVKGVKEFKMLQQNNNQMSLIISLPLK